MNRACGTCTLCCTVMKVTMEPPKPARTPCRHCSKGGCAIYADRPEPCATFECVWLASGRLMDTAMPAALRPDRSHVVLEINSKGYIIAHCHRPAAWKREPMHSFLCRMASQTRVLIEPEGEVLFLSPDGSTRPMVLVGINAETNERLYKIEVAE